MDTIQSDTVVSPDGTTIEYNTVGQGPGLLIISGGSRAAWHYLKLAEFLSPNYAVYLINRRGRGNSGAQGVDYSIRKEYEDAIAIIKKHNIPYIFGHSYGGLIALYIALNYPLEKIAVFEPGVFTGNNIPLNWLPKFGKQLGKNDYTGAMISMVKGLKMASFLKYVPNPLLKIVFDLLSRKNPVWDKDKVLLSLLPKEIAAGLKTDQDISVYKKITFPVLLLGGVKSPKFLSDILNQLNRIIPQSSLHIMKGMNHNTPDEFGPELTAEALKGFFVNIDQP